MQEILLVNGQAATQSRTSPTFRLGDLQTYSVQVDFSGSDLVGTLILKVSLDNSKFVDNSSSSQAVTGAASNIWNVSNVGYPYVQVGWTYTSGSGNWTVRVFLKDPIVKAS